MPAFHRREQLDEDRMERRRVAREDRDYAAYQRAAKREDKAAEQIGELVRDGKTIHYVYPQGGRYREGRPGDLIQFLIRNNYA